MYWVSAVAALQEKWITDINWKFVTSGIFCRRTIVANCTAVFLVGAAVVNCTAAFPMGGTGEKERRGIV